MLGLARALRAPGPRGPRPRPLRRPAARRRRHPARQERADRGQRLGRPARPGPVGPAPHDPGPARRGLRRPPPARAARPRTVHDGPAVQARAHRRHVPRRRRERRLQAHGGRDPRRSPAASTCAAPCPRTPGRWPRARSRRALTSCSSTASRSSRFAGRRAVAHRRADHLLPRSPRAPQGPRRAARGDGRPAPATSACGSAATGRRPRRSRPAAAGDPRIEWLGRHQRRGEGGPPAGRRRVLRPVAARRVVRRGAARGDGRRDAPSWPPTCPGYANVARAGQRRRAGPARRPRGAGRGPHAGCSRTTDLRRASWWRRGRRRAEEFSMDRLAEPLRRAATSGSLSAERWRTGPRMSAVLVVIVLAIIVVLVDLSVVVTLQRPGHAAEPDRERLGPDRRAAQAPLRPHPQPGRDGQGLRHPRAGDARGRHPGPQHGHERRRARRSRPQAENMLTGALKSLFALSRGLPRPQGEPELPEPAGGADRHRGPHRLRAAVLQRHRSTATTPRSRRSRPCVIAGHVQLHRPRVLRGRGRVPRRRPGLLRRPAVGRRHPARRRPGRARRPAAPLPPPTPGPARVRRHRPDRGRSTCTTRSRPTSAAPSS